MTHAQRARRIKEVGQVARYKAEEYLHDITRPGVDAAAGSWVFPDFLMWFCACDKPHLVQDLDHRIGATVRDWCKDHADELGGQYAQMKDGVQMIDRGDGLGLVPA